MPRELALPTTSQPTSPATATSVHRVGWAVLIALTLYVCYFSHLGAIGFVGPDEPRYAWIARDMAESGDWVTPRLFGRPWFEKPPLLYWGGAVFFKIFGQNHPEIAARLPSAISALLATFALAWLARRIYGEECARWLLLLLPTSVGMIGFSHAAATDLPFAGMLTISMVCAAVVLGLVPSTENTPILPRTPWLALVLFGLFEGLAVLAKGPAALILTGGAVFFWALFTKHWRDAFRLFHPAAIASFCLTALPWYILCARRNPDFLRIFIVEHNFKRYLTPEFQHIQPFWFYGEILLIAFVPWIALLFWAVYSSCAQRIRHKSLLPVTALLLNWGLFCLVFFSLSKSKLPGYILPAVPAFALLLARSCQLNLPRHRRLLQLFLFPTGTVLAALSLAILGVSLGMAHHSQDKENFGVAVGLLIFLLALPNFALFFAQGGLAMRSVIRSPIAASVFPVLLAVLLLGRLMPSLLPVDPSGRTLADELRAQKVPLGELSVADMNRGAHYSLNFYLRREVPDWNKAAPRPGYLLLRNKNCAQLVELPLGCEGAPAFLERSRYFIYKVNVAPSLPGTGGRRQPQ